MAHFPPTAKQTAIPTEARPFCSVEIMNLIDLGELFSYLLRRSSSNPNHARQILNRYPLGKQVDVYYNPSKPQDSVLERRLGCAVYVGLLVGPAVLVLGLLLTIKCFQNPNAARP